MKLRKPLFLILFTAVLTGTSACGEGDSEKREIAGTMREYVERNLGVEVTFDFVGLFNRRDTVFMGVTRPCAGVIYTVADRESKQKIRHTADVIFSKDYKTILCIEKSDRDPIEMIKDKLKSEIQVKISGTTNN